MKNMNKQQVVKQLVSELGLTRILFALPQKEVKRVLGLKSVGELASDIGMNYDSFQSRIERGAFPYPEVQLRRRAYYSPEQTKAITEMVTEERKNRKLTYKPKTA
ncbi:MAG: hypothetical protein AAGJ40_00060 [Planctomycetota bacterium]